MTGFFKGIATAMITPFDENGVNLEEFGKMIEYQIEGGTDALVILGTTGEPATMTETEKEQVITYSVKKAAGRIKIIVGTGSNDTAKAVASSVRAEKLGADGILAVTPYYNKCTQKGLYDYYKDICDAVKIPVIANGDIVDKSSLERVKEESGADIFMIGRGALGRPYIFAELDGRDYEYDRGACVREHIEILRGYLPDKVVANVMKLQLCHYAKGEDFAKTVRVAVGEAKCLNDIFAIVDKYLD